MMMKNSGAPSSASASVLLAALLALSLPASPVSSQSLPYAKPAFRYEPFNELDLTAQNIAKTKLGYTEKTWNVHRLDPVEKRGWAGLTASQLDGAIQLGFTENTWDCYINHYSYYDWDTVVDKGISVPLTELGWDEESWGGDGSPPSTEGAWWGQLTEAQREAAEQLCYFEDNWDMKDMNPNPTFFPYPMPEFRYVPWSELDLVTQNTAKGLLNYTEDQWNSPGSHLSERNTFLNLPTAQRDGAGELGFYTHVWDCFMNHYEAYYWNSFHADLLVAIETLGWTEDAWLEKEGAEAPTTESRFWIDLNPEEKAAATRLCYFEEIWNGDDLTTWYDYEAGTNTAVTADGPLPKDIDLNIFEGTLYAGRKPGSVSLGEYTVTGVGSPGVVARSGAVPIVAFIAGTLLFLLA